MNAAYAPINCEFHDLLEAAATLRKPAALAWLDAQGQHQQSLARIVDLHARQSQEFAQLDSGELLRLDAILSVNGHQASDF